MSKQVRVYLLPADIDSLMKHLRSKADLRVIDYQSGTPTPVLLESPLRSSSTNPERARAVSVRCFLAPCSTTNLEMAYFSKLGAWHMRLSSDVVEFSGCDFDDCKTLMIGRFYFQTDRLIENSIWSKDSVFIKWADSIFRLIKRHLTYSKSLEAYVGKEASLFKTQGGCFAAGHDRSGKPVCDD
jgi:hypothetical protein